MVRPKYPALVPIYFAEAEERLQSLRDAADLLTQDPADPHAWTLVRRTTHALGGNSAMMGFDDVADLARALERLATDVAERDARSDDALTVDRGLEALRILFAALRRAHATEEA